MITKQAIIVQRVCKDDLRRITFKLEQQRALILGGNVLNECSKFFENVALNSTYAQSMELPMVANLYLPTFPGLKT